MNAKQLKIVAIVLGVAVLLYLTRFLGDDGAGGTLSVSDGFQVPLDGALTRVDIVAAGGTDTLRLEAAAGGWTVDGYAADSAKVADLLPVLMELASAELVARNPGNHASMGVGDTGRRIDLYTGAGGPYSFHLGDRDLGGGGYFVRLPGRDEVFRLDSPAGGYLSRDRDAWRPRVFAAADTAGVREIVLRRGVTESVLHRGDDGWMVGEAPADSAAVDNLLRLLPSLSVTSFPTEEEEAAADFSLPDASLDVFSAGGGGVTDRELVLSLRFIEDENRGDWLVRLADGSEVYRLAQFTVNRLLPEALIPVSDSGGGSS